LPTKPGTPSALLVRLCGHPVYVAPLT